jgi:hypothetical protein
MNLGPTASSQTHDSGSLQPWWAIVLILGWGLAGLPGCGPAIDEEEMGRVIYTVPQVEGSQEPYPLPMLETPTNPDGQLPVPPGD